uniref:Cation efflux protein transmembrane domain-containing protein n=1 Tax=Kalanchoe fedtschenkoi TaxID=63787 RepID=A0A7N0UXI9_KALFE
MEKSDHHPIPADDNTPSSWNSDVGFSDRRYAFVRQATPIPTGPFLSRTASTIDMPPATDILEKEMRASSFPLPAFSMLRSASKPMKKLFLMISFNVAYSTVELLLGLFTGRIGLVSDAFHLTFGCGLLTFSLFAMAVSRKKADRFYTYGYKRLEVLSAFTNALFLLFMSFSIAVEALHAFIQDEDEHKHYLVISAVVNLLVNLVGVWFFRNYARITIVYKKPEDMNQHAVCLHVLADSVRSAGLILASWLLSLGVENAEVLCLGLVSITVFMIVMPLLKKTGGILLQMSPPSIPSSALSKCLRQINSREDVAEVTQSRFWEFVPGHVVGSLSVQVKTGIDDHPVLHSVHNVYHELGVQELTVEIERI